MKDSCITEVSDLGSKTVTFYTDEETVMAFTRMNVNAVFGKVWLDGDLGLVQMTRRSMKAEEMVARLGGAIRGVAREAGTEVVALGGTEVVALGGAAAFQGEWFEPGDEVVPGRDVRTCVTEVGSLGSKVVTFETDAETVAAIARLDLSAEFGPVLLDPGHGVVSLTRPSIRRERLVVAVDEWIREAICARGEAGQSLRGMRLRGPAEPRGTGVEAAGAFYVGKSARGYHDARWNGEDAAEAFVLETPPELVVEIEETAADEVKIERYTELGVTELWRVRRRAVWTESDPEAEVELLALDAQGGDRGLAHSGVLAKLGPGDIAGGLRHRI